MKQIRWEARPRQLRNGKWVPEAWVFIAHNRSGDFVKVSPGKEIYFDTEEEAKTYSENLAKIYFKQELSQ